MLSIFRRLMKNEHGATAIEYTLIASLIAVAAITAFTSVGTKVNRDEQRRRHDALIEPVSVSAWAVRQRTAHFFWQRRCLGLPTLHAGRCP